MFYSPTSNQVNRCVLFVYLFICLFVYVLYCRYFNRGIELLENMRSYFEGLAGELQQVVFIFHVSLASLYFIVCYIFVKMVAFDVIL